MGWIIMAAGIFAICGAVFNWDWYMNNYKARFFVDIMGRTGTRIFYGIFGTVLIVLGLLFAFGILSQAQ